MKTRSGGYRGMEIAAVVAAGLALTLAGGCEGYKSPGNLPTVSMQIGTGKYTIEIAKTDAHRQRGLMERDSMPENWGMIFVFPDEAVRGFWMKNTRIPLDIAYLDAGGKVVSIHQMKPYEQTSTASKGPAKYAIELNVGQAARVGLKEGDVVVIPVEAKETDR